jgi:hypothetical protein
VEHYERCLGEGAEKTEAAASIRNSMSRVAKLVTWVMVESKEPGADIFLDGKLAGQTPKRIGVNPGFRVIEARRVGAKPARFEFQTRGGERQVELNPVPLAKPKPRVVVAKKIEDKPKKGLPQYWFWGTAGLSVALAAVTTVFAVQAKPTHSDFQEAPSDELADKGENRRLLTNIFLGVTAAAAGASTALFFYTDFPWSKKERAADPDRREVSVGVGLRGTF